MYGAQAGYAGYPVSSSRSPRPVLPSRATAVQQKNSRPPPLARRLFHPICAPPNFQGYPQPAVSTDIQSGTTPAAGSAASATPAAATGVVPGGTPSGGDAAAAAGGAAPAGGSTDPNAAAAYQQYRDYWCIFLASSFSLLRFVSFPPHSRFSSLSFPFPFPFPSLSLPFPSLRFSLLLPLSFQPPRASL
jgi:hypothetical protein